MDLTEPLDSLAIPPTFHTRHLSFPDPKKIRIYDDTLRDGEQMPGVAFSPDQKLILARMLSDMGIHVMDVAFPINSESDRKALQLIIAAQKRGEIREDVEILAMCRSNHGDIDLVIETLKEIGASPDDASILILSTLSDLHLKYKLGKMLLKREGISGDKWLETPVSFFREANIDMITESIRYAKERGIDRIEFAAEDASRGHLDYAREWATACKKAGGTRMCFSDTCGVFTPEAVDYYIPEMVKILGDTPMTAHFHNDFGLGAINTVRAIAHGALYAGVTANGIGERAGNTSLHQVVMVLRNLYGVEIPGFRYDMLMELRRTIEIFSGIPVQPHEPIIGEGVYSHESGIHTAGISIHPAIYQFIREKDVGGTQKFIFGKHSGAAAIESVLARNEKAIKDAGIEITPELIKKLLDRAKDLREEMTPKDGYNDIIGSYYSHYRSLGISEERLIEMLLEMKK